MADVKESTVNKLAEQIKKGSPDSITSDAARRIARETAERENAKRRARR